MPRLDVPPGVFRSSYPGRPFVLAHDLAGHPLFELPRLLELARQLPADRVEYNAGNIPVGQSARLTPRNGLSVEETLLRIEECSSWMALKNVEIDRDYGALLDTLLGGLRAEIEGITPGMNRCEAFIFVSSAGAVTPYHMDPEHNFLLQVRGTKTVTQYDHDDRVLLTEREVETFYAGGVRGLEFRSPPAEKERRFDLTPGSGLYFPVTQPHWVKVGPQWSVSLSVTWRSYASDRAEILYRINSHLRRLGMTPTTPGLSAWRDGLKYGAFRSAGAVARTLRRGRQTTAPESASRY
jgi:hypothetical protein